MKYLAILGLVALCVAERSNVHPKERSNVLPTGPDHRVVGGQRAGLGQFPWMASIRKTLDIGPIFHACGGTVVDEEHILTAAHCCDAVLPRLYHVVVGGIDNLRNESDGVNFVEQHINVARAIVHADFDPINFENDICLLRLEQQIIFTDYVGPATLPESTLNLTDGTRATVLGWGGQEEGDEQSEFLHWANLPVVSDERCAEAYMANPDSPPVLESMMCAGNLETGGVDACGGDSGGPYMLAGTSTVVGIISWGNGCARPGFPGVGTDVAYFREWIDDHLTCNPPFC